jgi:hypothetical protein
VTSANSCELGFSGGVPVVVRQALDDRRLSPLSQRVMWKLQLVLDLMETRPLYEEAVAKLAGVKIQSAGKALAELSREGYLECDPDKTRPRWYRMPWSRRTHNIGGRVEKRLRADRLRNAKNGAFVSARTIGHAATVPIGSQNEGDAIEAKGA